MVNQEYVNNLIIYQKDDREKVKTKMEKKGYKLIMQPAAPIGNFIASLQVYVAPDNLYFMIPFAGHNGKGFVEYPDDDNAENVDVFRVIQEIGPMFKTYIAKKQEEALSTLIEHELKAGREDIVAELLLLGRKELFKRQDCE